MPSLEGLHNLFALGVWNNQLSGTFPDLENLSNLFLLYISHNRFYGDMPEPPSPNRMASSHATLCSNFSTRWTITVFVIKDVRFFIMRQPSYMMSWQTPFPGCGTHTRTAPHLSLTGSSTA